MPVSSSQRREALLMLSYAAFWGPQDEKGLLCLIADQLRLPNKIIREALEKLNEMAIHIITIDQWIEAASATPWFSVGYCEKAILRIILFEKAHGPTLDDKILLSEANRLSKKFTGQQSCVFINGLLMNIFKKINEDSVNDLNILIKDTKNCENETNNLSIENENFNVEDSLDYTCYNVNETENCITEIEDSINEIHDIVNDIENCANDFIGDHEL